MAEQQTHENAAEAVSSVAPLELLGVLLDGSSALIGLKDLEGCYVFANRELEAMLGLAAGGIIGLTDLELMPAAIAETLRARDLAVVKNARPARSFDRYFVAGEELECATVRFPYPDSEGRILGTGFVAIDIREHRQQSEAGNEADLGRAQRTIADLTRAVDDLKQRASTDRLTGALNRGRLEENAQFELLRFQRYGHPVSLLFIDLDRFKEVNDNYGHPAGDQVLVSACEILRQCMRTTDLLGRWGGEEFLLLLPNTGITSARLLGERIRLAIQAHDFGAVGKITASFGIAECQKGESWDSLVARADAAMYRAKRSGRNRVEMDMFLPGREGTAEHVAAHFVHLVWHESYDCGEASIDSQHRLLFECANSLITAVIECRPKEEIDPLVHALVAEVVNHFNSEEAVLNGLGYPAALEHAALHAKLLAQAGALVEKYQRGELGIGELFSYLAYDVVAQHMLGEDRKFFPYLADKSAP